MYCSDPHICIHQTAGHSNSRISATPFAFTLLQASFSSIDLHSKLSHAVPLLNISAILCPSSLLLNLHSHQTCKHTYLLFVKGPLLHSFSLRRIFPSAILLTQSHSHAKTTTLPIHLSSTLLVCRFCQRPSTHSITFLLATSLLSTLSSFII